jgi:hypothetical protein
MGMMSDSSLDDFTLEAPSRIAHKRRLKMASKSTADYLFTPGSKIGIFTGDRIVLGVLRGVNHQGFLIDLEQNGEMEFIGWRHATSVRVNPSKEILASWRQEAETNLADRAENRIVSREMDRASLKVSKAQAKIFEKDAEKR